MLWAAAGIRAHAEVNIQVTNSPNVTFRTAEIKLSDVCSEAPKLNFLPDRLEPSDCHLAQPLESPHLLIIPQTFTLEDSLGDENHAFARFTSDDFVITERGVKLPFCTKHPKICSFGNKLNRACSFLEPIVVTLGTILTFPLWIF